MGGSEIEAQRVSHALIERGHTVEILCPGGPPMPQAPRWKDDCGIPVRTFGGGVPRRIRGHVFALRTAWTLLAEWRRYDLVYFLMPGLQVALGTLAARLLGKPFLMKFSGSNEIRRLRNSLAGRLQLSFVGRWAGRILVLNPGMMAEAAECGFPASRMMWMPNPVDTGVFRPPGAEARAELREKLGIPADAEVVLFVGRLAPEKELGSLVEGFRAVAAARPKALLILAGDGPCREEIRAAAGGLADRGRIRLAGAVPSSSVHEWLKAADVFALVSSLEGLPVSLIEAMATGLPSVVSDIPANRQLVEPGVQGLVAEARNAAAIGDALAALLAGGEARIRMGEAARARIGDGFSPQSVVCLYEEVFGHLMNRPAPLSPDRIVLPADRR
jgi:glycosyltransferase involved in cell wall biosynthesis